MPDPASQPLTDSERTRLNERLVWLDRTLADVDAAMRRTPKLFGLLVAAVPAFWFGGAAIGLAVSFTCICVPFVTLYVNWGHQNEYKNEAEMIRRRLATD